MYKFKYLDKAKSTPISSLNQKGENALNVLSLEVASLGDTVKQFQQVFSDYYNASLQYNDLLAKYHTDEGNKKAGGYRLPGIINPLPSYDVATLKEDSKKIDELKNIVQELDSQRNIYFNMMARHSNQLFNIIRDINKTSQDLDILIEGVNPLV